MDDVANTLEFAQMAPLKGDEASIALARLRESRDWVNDLSRIISLEDAQLIREAWDGVNDTEGFQSRVVKPFLESLTRHTTTGFTWHAAPGALDHGMLYLSNHRDIVLDPALINVAMLQHGRGSTEIGIGSNLLGSPWVNDLVRLNRCFIVERSGTARERYEYSLRTARYIRHVVSQSTPVWLAHREGRAKDGMDTTAPALIRTLSDGCDPRVWNELAVVPVSISYEWDPCDVFKVNELLHKEHHGEYKKQPGEDQLSMLTGLSGQKGRVHIEFGQKMDWPAHLNDSRPERETAKLFDKRLAQGMQVWPNQILSAEALGMDHILCNYAVEVTEADQEAWQERKLMVVDALHENGWSKEVAGIKWCEVLAAPLKLNQLLLDQA